MVLSATEKQALIAATHETAWHMVDDLEYMRETIAKPRPTSDELRRMSNVLRRLLVDKGGDLKKIGAPRLERSPRLLAPNADHAMREYERDKCYFASIGTGGIFGLQAEQFAIQNKAIRIRPPILVNGSAATYELYGGKSPLLTISLPLDRFLSQSVLYFDKTWISRRDTIKYVANIAGGVHSGSPYKTVYVLLRRVRQIGSLWINNGQPMWRVNVGNMMFGQKPIDVERNGVDFVLVQLVSAARYLTTSPDVIELEEMIKNEPPH